MARVTAKPADAGVTTKPGDAGVTTKPGDAGVTTKPADAGVVVEPAGAGDVDALVRLLGILFTQESEMSPDAVRQRRGIERILGNPAIGRLFVARDAHGAVIGTCCLLLSESTFLGEPAAWLEDVVVDPAQRGTGAGAALLDHVIAYCRREGIQRISLLTDRDNTNAQGFYESRGFARSSMLAYRKYLAG